MVEDFNTSLINLWDKLTIKRNKDDLNNTVSQLDQMNLTGMKNTIPEIKYSLNGINNSSDTPEEKIGELEDVARETIQNEVHRKKGD